MQCSSRVSASRRELNSHEAASPLSSAEREPKARLRGNAPQERREEDQTPQEGVSRTAGAKDCAAERHGQVALSRTYIALRARPLIVSLWSRRCRSRVAFAQHTHERRIQDTGRQLNRRRAGSFGVAPLGVSNPLQVHCLQSASAALPNPTLKRTRNGMALGPRGRVVYLRPRGPSATPPRAA